MVVIPTQSCNYLNYNMIPNYVYTFTSPWYPQPYPGGWYSCFFEGLAPANHTIRFYCDTFNIYSSAGCSSSRFSFSPSGDPQYSDRQSFCGLQSGITLYTSGNKFVARFDNAIANYYLQPGFYCSIEVITDDEDTTTDAASTNTETPVETTTTPAEPSNCDCGARNSAARIVGGSETAINEYPFIVGLVQMSGDSIYCGGSLIAEEWVLTASHCVDGFKTTDLFVTLGDHDTESLEEAPAYSEFVIEIIMHEDYNSTSVDNDIALLRIKNKVTFTNAVNPVCLPFKYSTDDFDGETAIAMGWGTTSFQGETSSVLQDVHLPVESYNNCKRHSDYASRLTENMFCTYAPGKDACQGDSGGPLVHSKNGRLYQIGIVSWGIECAKAAKPGVYTKVNNYLDWIKEKTGEQFCTN